MYVFITDGYVVSKDSKLHTVFIYLSVFIYDDSSHVTCDLTFPSLKKKNIMIHYGQRW